MGSNPRSADGRFFLAPPRSRCRKLLRWGAAGRGGGRFAEEEAGDYIRENLLIASPEATRLSAMCLPLGVGKEPAFMLAHRGRGGGWSAADRRASQCLASAGGSEIHAEGHSLAGYAYGGTRRRPGQPKSSSCASQAQRMAGAFGARDGAAHRCRRGGRGCHSRLRHHKQR